MTEYQCTAVIGELTYEFITMGAVCHSQAVAQFEFYLMKEINQNLEYSTETRFKRINLND